MENDRRANRGFKNRKWFLTLALGLGLWLAPQCEAQIEVEAFVSNRDSNSVSVIDTKTNTVIATLGAGIGPLGVAVTPDGRFAYVANGGNGGVSNTVSIIDVATNTVISPPIQVGNEPFGVAVSPDGKMAYVTNYGILGTSPGNSVSVVDTATNTVVNTVTVGTSPVGVAITPNSAFAYVTNNNSSQNPDSNSISVINTLTNQVSQTILAEPGPEGIAITPNGQFAYVANTGSPSFPGPTISVIATATNTVEASPTVGNLPVGVAISPDGKFAYVANELDNTVSVIDSATNTVVHVIDIPPSAGGHPFGVAVTPDGAFVYVTLSFNVSSANSVSVISTASNSVVANITVGGSPFTLGSFVGPNIIVSTGGPLSIGSVAALTNLGFGNFVDFNGGTLRTTGSLVISQTISLLALGGTIDTNGFDSNFSGEIINSGSLTKIGVGTLTLAGSNSSSGGTSILGGVLSVSGDTNLGTGNINIANDAELLTTGTNFVSNKIVNLGIGGGALASISGAAATYSGVIQGNGPLNIGDGTNQGRIILQAANTYTGGTTINGGTLEISADANLGAPSGALVFNGGTLQTLASFATNRTVKLNAAGGIFEPGTGTIFTETGTILGGGGLTKSGPGTAVLAGNNGYVGGTTVLEGILRAGSAGGFVNNTAFTIQGGMLDLNNFSLTMSSLNGTGGVTNLGAAALTIDNSGTDVFSGSIRGAGSLTKTGPGQQTLSGDNSYIGGTIVLEGMLRAGVAGSFVSNTAFTIQGGTLDLNNFNLTMSSLRGSGGVVNLGSAALTMNDSGIDTYSGIIQGTGSLTKIGSGTQILGGKNSYTGGTTVLEGILRADSAVGFVTNTAYTVMGGTLDLNSFNLAVSSLNGNGGLVNLASAALSINNAGTDAYSGTIQGAGSLTKIGSGTLILSGDNSYSGGTFLEAGTLVVNSTRALGFGDVVVDGGVLKADPQPINVAGNYMQNPGGTLQLRLGGSAPGQYDFLSVSVHAALNGTLQLVFLNTFQPRIGDKLTLVLAAGGVSGQFSNVLDPISSLVGLELVYQPDAVLLEFASDFKAFAQTPNQLTVATQLDTMAFDPRETRLISFLQNEPVTNLAADFERISPDSLSAIYEVSFSTANVQKANLENRFAEIRSGSTGFTSSLNISNSPGAMIENKDGKAVIEPSKNVLTPSPENKWGIWVTGSGDFVNVTGDGNGKGYDFTTGGVTLGLDFRLTKSFAVGVALGYAHTSTSLTGDGSIDVNSGRGGLYASFHNGGYYLDGYIGGGFSGYDTRRSTLGGNAIGSTDGGELNTFIGGGYEFRFGGWSVGPVAGLQFTEVGFSAFTENGSLVPLKIESNNEGSLRTNLGLTASYLWKAGSVLVRPSAQATWEHEYLYNALPVDAGFASGAGTIFTVHGPALGQNIAVINAGFDVQWSPRIGTYFGYNGQVGRGNYDAHTVMCGAHLSF